MSNKSHLAAPYRNYLSATAKTVLKHSLVSSEESHLDYGCGRGGDVERLQMLGYRSTGYDPYYFPADSLEPLDVVTMSYVLNVIADPEERHEALRSAWNLSLKRLIVSANVSGKAAMDEGKFTTQGTFVKSYSHIELKAYIESVLGFEAISLAKDKFVIHRDGRQFTPLHREKVLEEIEAKANEGWVAPWQTIIKKYYSNLKYRPEQGTEEFDKWSKDKAHYRLICRHKWLPGKKGQDVRVIHLRGGLEGEHTQWAIVGLRRRNRIAELKFHCIEQSFLHEFAGFKDFSFLDTEQVKIYS